MSELQSALAALQALEIASPTPPAAAKTTPRPASTLPAFADITVATCYLFHNEGKQNLWRKYTLNVQLFTQTTPFTPHFKDAAYLGSAVIRNPDAFELAMRDYQKTHPAFPDDLWETRYAPILNETRRLPYDPDHDEFPRIGQVAVKGAGTNYEYGSLARAWITPHAGLQVDLMLMDGTISFHEFKWANNPKPTDPAAHAAHNPHRLWVSKPRAGSRGVRGTTP